MKRTSKPNSQMWTESEAAQMLRCSTAKIQRLRLTRQLGYYPGRPVLISQDDLETYVASVKIIRVRMPEPAGGYVVVPAHTRPRAFKLLTRSEAARLVRRSSATIANWCNGGKLPFLPGRGSTIDEVDLRDFILSNTYQPITQAGAALLSDSAIEEIRRKARIASLKRRFAR
ncbi:helix-turn-helix domain-containing protein [Bradyrhizobium sp. 150]|uniref:helix-turn-helix domain-containing protein n=1 Tax=Bradyrhizobium sp. 150 TaxID=2782625 RepID=UPI001FF9182F|nr:helix-turn-helix domain-containing protein [Bradyrhizobium sp. 150]MCK1670401.1 helix-turn-helix domain-containing protein [Bradyrhizobium sp. 150]